MNQRQYNIMKNQYAKRMDGSYLSYRYRRGQEEDEPLPYAVFFRIRLILCVMFFMFFAYAEHTMMTEIERTKVYQALEQNTSGEHWKNYAVDVFSSFNQ